MLSVDGDADAAVKAKIRNGCNKFRQLVPLHTNSILLRTITDNEEDCTAVVHETVCCMEVLPGL